LSSIDWANSGSDEQRLPKLGLAELLFSRRIADRQRRAPEQQPGLAIFPAAAERVPQLDDRGTMSHPSPGILRRTQQVGWIVDTACGEPRITVIPTAPDAAARRKSSRRLKKPVSVSSFLFPQSKAIEQVIQHGTADTEQITAFDRFPLARAQCGTSSRRSALSRASRNSVARLPAWRRSSEIARSQNRAIGENHGALHDVFEFTRCRPTMALDGGERFVAVADPGTLLLVGIAADERMREERRVAGAVA
jgi:hypothetical protein